MVVQRVTRSVAELQALVMKAARGAGAPLGTAEELYVAVPYVMAVGALPEVIAGLEHGLRDLSADVDDAQVAGGTDGLIKAMLAARCVGDVAATIGPQEITVEHLETLQTYAAKTFVPATEASRLSGAGAGLTDND